MLTVQGYKNAGYGCKLVNHQIIREHLDDYEILKISLDGSLIYPDKEVLMCDSVQPMSYVNNFFIGKALCIDKAYADAHMQEVLDTVIFICANTKKDSIAIDDSYLINEDVLNAIISNPNIKTVSLGCQEDVVVLTEELYEKFKNTHIEVVKTKAVVDSLKEKFDSLIGYNTHRNLIGFDNYEGLQKKDMMFLSSELTEDEIFYLKFLNPTAEVNFKYTNYDNVFKCIYRLKNCGHTGKLVISIEQKNDLNSYIFNNINNITNFDNIEVNLSGSVHSLSEYVKYEKKLIDLIMPAINFSPFEKYLYAYNQAKKFKKYKENKEDKTSARDLYQIMDNEYMVCVGYSKLLGDLLDKLGIENYEDSVSVDVGLDDISNDATVLPDFIYDEKTGEMKEVKTEAAGHARRMAHVVDPKYGIDGYYFTDPTWDNDMVHDTYNYALMTQEEYIGMDRYNYYKTLSMSELFFVKTLEDFYLKINIYLDKNRKKNEVEVIRSLLNIFEDFDSEFYSYLVNKYHDIEKYRKEFTKEEIQDILLDMGERIVSKSNHLVDGHVFREGITALYSQTISDENELEEKVNEIIEYNKKRHAVCFPTRYKIDRDENRMVLHNMYNKFDIDEEPKLNI